MTVSRIPSVEGGIQPTIVDAKGDIIAATAADTVARLAVGSNNQVLMADSTQSSGLKYASEATATLTAKGDILSATAANTLSRLAVGTDGQVLTAASGQSTGLQWATPSSGGMTLLSTTTLSGATVTISSISQSYNSLFGVVYGATWATSDGRLVCKPNNASTTVYSYNIEGGSIDSRNADDFIYFNADLMLRTNANNAWSFTINNYTSTANYKPFFNQGVFYSSGSSALRYHSAAGAIATNSAISSLVFTTTFTGGNFSTGTVLLYGVK